MILWIAFAIAAAAVIAALVRPMLAEPLEAGDPQDADLAIYRDQLAEIDADLDRGLIDSTEAENARVELARRLIDSSPPESKQVTEQQIASDPFQTAAVSSCRARLCLCDYNPAADRCNLLGCWFPGLPWHAPIRPDARRHQARQRSLNLSQKSKPSSEKPPKMVEAGRR